MSVLPGFVKGSSDNLPKIDTVCMFSFLGNNPDFMSAEMRGAKAMRSGRESYGDNAIGYVQVMRNLNECTVRAKVTPEHRIHNKAYNVQLVCDEVQDKVVSVQCEDCAASSGGCKHAIALLAWLHRRSEEPSVTSTTCYWKKAKLSAAAQGKTLMAKNIGSKKTKCLEPKTGRFLLSMRETGKGVDNILNGYYKMPSDVETLSMFNLFATYSKGKDNRNRSVEDFFQFCAAHITDDLCKEAEQLTVNQSDSNLWYELRYGRVTASKSHEAAHCHTLDGCLVETISGAIRLKDTAAMRRGRLLEKEVLRVVEKERGIKIRPCGFLLSTDCPVMGASPDGISNDYVIEVKCPFSTKTLSNYYNDSNDLSKRCEAQIQIQMYWAKKDKGLFCVASPNFEVSKEVKIIEVSYNQDYCKDLIEKCVDFWKRAIYPKLVYKF